MHQDAEVNNVPADGVGCIHRPLEAAARLHKLHPVGLGIEHLEPEGAVEFPDRVLRSLPSVGGKVFAQAVGVGGVEGDVIETVDARAGRKAQYFNILRGAQAVIHACLILGIGPPRCADNVAVVVVGRDRIGCVDGNVRDAGDGGASGAGLCKRGDTGNNGEKCSKNPEGHELPRSPTTRQRYMGRRRQRKPDVVLAVPRLDDRVPGV